MTFKLPRSYPDRTRFGTPAGDGPIPHLADLPAGIAPARWVLKVAAAGIGHHLGLIGPLGSG